MSASFPLILTFSPGEKEQPLSVPGSPKALSAEASRGFVMRLGAFLPLPKGEGRGEG